MSDQPEPIKPDPEQKPKRPRDANQLAKLVVDLATGEAQELAQADPKAIKRGKAGGQARAKNLTPEQRSEIARLASEQRWAANSKGPEEEQEP